MITINREHHPNIDPKKKPGFNQTMTPVDPHEQYIDDHFGGVYADGRGKDTEKEKAITRELVRKYKEERSKPSE
ncbi:hypothetical protein HUG15_19940 [Salicibibacter cibarius]|uniref:Uncharacterized protein n=1 Tax=Salicibibacter cibarius TaxID=2743000 RepID=A0A7T6Z6C3_9BACI|nr:hypothetical protein [Salicibibacter cibarius]QQK77632.1 hypothetical protein HUG15_19940 [Salicibibacter cibarius]